MGLHGEYYTTVTKKETGTCSNQDNRLYIHILYSCIIFERKNWFPNAYLMLCTIKCVLFPQVNHITVVDVMCFFL